MPTRTRALPPPPPVPTSRSARAAAAPLIGGALFAAAEVAGSLMLFGLASDRAEASLFLALRPALLIAAAVAVASWTWPRRAACYALGLLLAAGAETILIISLGNLSPWPEMAGGLAAGAILAMIADLVLQAFRRWRKRAGTIAGALLLLLLFSFGSALRPYEALVLGPTAPREAREPKPPLLLMTGLPIVWGEGGAFDPNSRPAESYRALEREFAVRPIDAIEPAALAGARLMLLAQPRQLAPEELVALDRWIRDGGRVLILTDPRFAGADALPLLDIRRPPARGLLGPLLDHWGLRLDEGEDEAVEEHLDGPEGSRKLVLIRPGRFAATGNSCRIMGPPWLARCRIGRGEAVLVADADLLMDAAWVWEGEGGADRHLRRADNMLLVAGWLDGLAGVERRRADRSVAWIAPAADRGRAKLLAALPILAALLAGLGLLFASRRAPTTLSTGRPIENGARTKPLPDP